MNFIPISTPAIAIASLALGLAACVHTPPGTAVNVALAKKAEMVASAIPTKTTLAPAGAKLAAVEPELPGSDKAERVGEAFSRGTFCMSAGKDEEAIGAFQEAVKIDPAFAEAWQNLAQLYEKTGQEKLALEAFRRSKKLARQ